MTSDNIALANLADPSSPNSGERRVFDDPEMGYFAKITIAPSLSFLVVVSIIPWK